MNLTINIFLSYLIGSIPTSIILSKAVAGIDIRQHGSGNAGGTNVVRVLGWKLGLIVMFVDVLKGYVATAFISNFQILSQTQTTDIFMSSILCGVAAILGHVWTIFARFKGGKGVATGLGMMIAVSPFDILIGLAVFLIIVFISRYVSVGSIFGIASVPISIYLRKNYFGAEIDGYEILLFSSILISLFIIFTHRSNIKRLLNGTENKFLAKK